MKKSFVVVLCHTSFIVIEKKNSRNFLRTPPRNIWQTLIAPWPQELQVCLPLITVHSNEFQYPESSNGSWSHTQFKIPSHQLLPSPFPTDQNPPENSHPFLGNQVLLASDLSKFFCLGSACGACSQIAWCHLVPFLRLCVFDKWLKNKRLSRGGEWGPRLRNCREWESLSAWEPRYPSSSSSSN